jgi:ribonuclease D
MKDSVISDIASVMPQKPSDFNRSRSLKTSHAWTEAEVLKVVSEALAMPKERLPKPEPRLVLSAKQKLLYDALKLLLKVQAGRHNIAERLIATADDIKILVTKQAPDIAALQGWRRQIFGEEALLLKQGKICLQVVDGQVKFIRS